MLEDFIDERVDLGEVTLRVRHGGAGPAVLLVHGHPRTGATWHRVAPALAAAGLSVVVPDMRGYGASSAPPPLPDHAQQSKRAVAGDLAALMSHLGHERFAVAGHDRGCYVALRLALDHRDRVAGLVAMDGIPISEALDRCDARFASAYWHWFFFNQPDKPERAILADPDAWYALDEALMGAENHAEVRAAVHDPAVVRAMVEDYRAGLAVDQHHERADRAAGRTVACPTLVLWSSRDDLADLHGDPLAVWRPWAADLRGHAIDSGHHMAEEAPGAVITALRAFLGQ
ncbi:alpha/beta hydrolase [Luedemannella helvata]|uniref:Alpha/beta hydrolase n=1 Tax=Luedemannella helvata TaxID=349315 RepID=A0ABP4VT36_9ACTN